MTVLIHSYNRDIADVLQQQQQQQLQQLHITVSSLLLWMTSNAKKLFWVTSQKLPNYSLLWQI